MMIREPAVAGRFYAAEPEACRRELEDCLRRGAEPGPGAGPGPGPEPGKIHAGEPVADSAAVDREDRPEPCGEASAAGAGGTPLVDRPIGGIVPHAGWICSGAVAARVFTAISERRQPAAVVIFGAIHVRHGPQASLFDRGAWETPLGLAYIDERLSDRLHGHTGLMECDPHAHEREHSIEVEVPFIQRLMPKSLIVPIMVPPNEKAAVLGTAIGAACRQYGADVVFIASTDLTHYGPTYGFTPQGVGPAGLKWAKEVNDRRMIDVILAMREGAAVEEAAANQNACGAGAIAATIAACKAYGAKRAELLEHTNSYEVLRERFQEPARDAVGYAGVVIGD